MAIDPRRIEVIDEEMARVLARKTGGERLRIASGMFEFARKLLTARVREEHPDWEAGRVGREVARRISHGAV